MERRIKELDNPDEEQAAREWLDWAQARLGDINPVHRRLRIPRVPEPTRDQLQRFLKGFNAYGPF